MAELLAIHQDLKNLTPEFKLNSDGSGVIRFSGNQTYKPEVKFTAAEINSALAAFTKPKEIPQPVEEPKPTSKVLLGINAGGWGSGSVADIGSTGVKAIRLSSSHVSSEAAAFRSAGFNVIGIYGEGGSISSYANRASAYAAEVVTAAKTFGLTAVEVLNEPGGNWFWSDPTNYSGYVTLVKATYEAMRSAGLSTKVLASWDGGKGGSVEFGEHIKNLGVLGFCDGVTVHPYGGSSGQYGGAKGDLNKCAKAHEQSQKPLWITEIGWPTGTGATGDSQRWTEAQQAENVEHFCSWAKATSYVAAVTIYGYVDQAENIPAMYGLEKRNRGHKPGFAKLGEAAKSV